MRRFEYIKGNSAKFWEIERKGSNITTWWGRISHAAQTKTKEHPDYMTAEAEFDKLIRAKLKAGYVEVAKPSAAPEELPERPIKLVAVDGSEVLELSGEATKYILWRMIEIGVIDRFAAGPDISRWKYRATRRMRLEAQPEVGSESYDQWFAEFLTLSARERAIPPIDFEVGGFKFLLPTHWIVTPAETERLLNKTNATQPRRRNITQRQKAWTDDWVAFHDKVRHCGYVVEPV